jgi:hypothetical protein
MDKPIWAIDAEKWEDALTVAGKRLGDLSPRECLVPTISEEYRRLGGRVEVKAVENPMRTALMNCPQSKPLESTKAETTVRELRPQVVSMRTSGEAPKGSIFHKS